MSGRLEAGDGVITREDGVVTRPHRGTGMIPTEPGAEPPPPPPPPPPAGTLAGWFSWNGTQALQEDGSVVVAFTGNDSAITSYTINTNEGKVPNTRLGATYRISGSVRSIGQTAGKTLRVVWREHLANGGVNEVSMSVGLIAGYQPFVLEYQPVSADRPIDVRLSQAGAAAGDSFQVQAEPAITVTDPEPPPPPPPPDPDPEGLPGWSVFAGSQVLNDDDTVTVTSDGSGSSFSIYSDAGTIQDTQAGAVYAGTARVRGVGATVGRQATLIFREFLESGQAQSQQAITLTSSFQTIAVTHTAQQSGRAIDLRVSVQQTASGQEFELEDEPQVVITPPAPPPPPPSAVPTAPTGLTVTPGNGFLDVACTPNPAAQGVDYYVFYVNGVWDNVQSPNPSRRLSGLTNGTTYQIRVSAHNAVGHGPWGAIVSGAPNGPVAPPPDPPSGSGTFGRPFPLSPLYRPANGVAFDTNSEGLVSAAIGAARSGNSGRGPNILGSGISERRWRGVSTDPEWLFRRSSSATPSATMRAPQGIQGSGVPDDTIGVYDESSGKVVRQWGGDSVALDIDRTSHICRSSTIGIADLNGDGLPSQGIGTAWGRMSVEGVILGEDWEQRKIDHRVKFALGNNLLAKSYRAPAISYENKATATAPVTVPMGTTFVHLLTEEQVEDAIANAKLSGDALDFARMFWTMTSYYRGYGLVAGDGTGNNGFNIYAGHPSELPVSQTNLNLAVRLPKDGVTSGQANQTVWANSNWRALVAG